MSDSELDLEAVFAAIKRSYLKGLEDAARVAEECVEIAERQEAQGLGAEITAQAVETAKFIADSIRLLKDKP